MKSPQMSVHIKLSQKFILFEDQMKEAIIKIITTTIIIRGVAR